MTETASFRHATILLSQSPRPWNRKQVSLVSAAVAWGTRSRYSHACLDIGGMTYGFRASGVEILPRASFDSRAFEVSESGTCLADMEQLERIMKNGARYDWHAGIRAASLWLQGLPFPVEEPPPRRYTCTSFVAAVCRIYAPDTSIVNRYVTVADIQQMVMLQL